ncbi:hypothetical protein D5S18_00865 [Nocardia panacis]|uniref:PPE domain-containing protein n=2 Tax=Nocardia panacis TaxID=2340916 RepID=A0A3A4KCQ8_9NOCA|nr:hypothetical protein D5S18_00865 [Nocardia panacis]
MNVDINELVGLAPKLARLMTAMGTMLPAGTVEAAGADPVSRVWVPELKKRTGKLFNALLGTVSELQDLTERIGAAAVEYSRADDQSARELGGIGREIVSNHADGQMRYPPRPVPVDAAVPAGPTSSMTIAQQFRDGQGPAHAMEFATKVGDFVNGPLTEALVGLDNALPVLNEWVPVGAQAAEKITKFRGQLDALGFGLRELSADINVYGAAYTSARKQHPTPDEIQQARDQLVAATKSKNQAATQAALANYKEKHLRSAETMTDFAKTGGVTMPSSDGSLPDGTAPGGNAPGGTDPSGANQSGGGGQNGANEMSMLSSMLPGLLSNMASMQQMGRGDGLNPLDDYGYDDYPNVSGISGIPSFGGGPGGDSGIAAAESASIPMGGGLANIAGASARAPLVEPLSAAAAAANARGVAGAGSPMMPYMPLSPGMGGGAGNKNERSRVVAWHPDRRLYVDETEHTELVIGEKPTIAPTVTPPTPTQTNQSQSGGSV